MATLSKEPSAKALARMKEDPTDVHSQLAAADLVDLDGGRLRVGGSVSIYGIKEKAEARALANKLAEMLGVEVNEPGPGYAWFEVGYCSSDLTIHFEKSSVSKCGGCPLTSEEA